MNVFVGCVFAFLLVPSALPPQPLENLLFFHLAHLGVRRGRVLRVVHLQVRDALEVAAQQLLALLHLDDVGLTRNAVAVDGAVTTFSPRSSGRSIRCLALLDVGSA